MLYRRNYRPRVNVRCADQVKLGFRIFSAKGVMHWLVKYIRISVLCPVNTTIRSMS